MSSAGLFVPQLKGRVHLRSGLNNLDWMTEFDLNAFYTDEVKRIHAGFSLHKFEGWYRALDKHTFIRRAVDDLVIAMRAPTEAFVFHRGFEWLEDGLKISKKEMANALGVEHGHYKELGKIANAETGVRHASRSGSKIRADAGTYSTWMCGLVDGINYARSKIEQGFVRMTPEEVATAKYRGAARSFSIRLTPICHEPLRNL